MSFLSELWFLVSTAILEFRNWKKRRKKLRKPHLNPKPSVVWRPKCVSLIILLIFVVIGAFTTFTSPKGKFNNMPEIDSDNSFSSSKLSTYSKTGCIVLFSQPGRTKFPVSLKNVLSTETKLSNQCSINKNISTSYSCSPGYLLNISQQVFLQFVLVHFL